MACSTLMRPKFRSAVVFVRSSAEPIATFGFAGPDGMRCAPFGADCRPRGLDRNPSGPSDHGTGIFASAGAALPFTGDANKRMVRGGRRPCWLLPVTSSDRPCSDASGDDTGPGGRKKLAGDRDRPPIIPSFPWMTSTTNGALGRTTDYWAGRSGLPAKSSHRDGKSRRSTQI
jgi:hypothetical protein